LDSGSGYIPAATSHQRFLDGMKSPIPGIHESKADETRLNSAIVAFFSFSYESSIHLDFDDDHISSSQFECELT
jgi:hypothetical protein